MSDIVPFPVSHFPFFCTLIFLSFKLHSCESFPCSLPLYFLYSPLTDHSHPEIFGDLLYALCSANHLRWAGINLIPAVSLCTELLLSKPCKQLLSEAVSSVVISPSQLSHCRETWGYPATLWFYRWKFFDLPRGVYEEGGRPCWCSACSSSSGKSGQTNACKRGRTIGLVKITNISICSFK